MSQGFLCGLSALSQSLPLLVAGGSTPPPLPRLGREVVQTPRVAFYAQQSVGCPGPAGQGLGLGQGGLALPAPGCRGQAALHFPRPDASSTSKMVQLPEYLLAAPLIKMSPL